jgi:predicted nucleotidyltransferase
MTVIDLIKIREYLEDHLDLLTDYYDGSENDEIPKLNYYIALINLEISKNKVHKTISDNSKSIPDDIAKTTDEILWDLI